MTPPDPLALFGRWYESAQRAGIDKPHAAALATVGADDQPSCRIVLLSSYDERGFVFHANYESRKGEDIASMPKAALTFWWDPLDFQIRIEGPVEKTSAEESDVYFAGRPRGSQLGAWASAQSRVIKGPAELSEAMAVLSAKYEGQPVPRPPHWGGYRVIPQTMEFWINRADRLHDRLCYHREADGRWRVEHLAP
jgi:pyridoxamine 5'-phosphate oxidase